MEFVKSKNFCVSKDTNKKVKKAAEWEKIFVSHVFNKGLISRLHKELLHTVPQYSLI